jgi:transposase
MPWKASSVMEERLRFVARLLDGEAMTEVCRDFGISRKTGYKIFDRYREHGLEALSDRSRRPVRYANQLPAQIETLVVRLKAEKPHWGARKIREQMMAMFGWRDHKMPALYIAKANRDKLAISGMEKIEAYDQMENIADLAMPTDQNRIVTFESNRRKKP